MSEHDKLFRVTLSFAWDAGIGGQENEWEALESVGIFVHGHETNFSTNSCQ